MIAFDLETTGLPKAEGSDLVTQPKIIEFGAIKLDDDLKEVDRLEFLVNPQQQLDPKITKITGITDDDLKNEKPFMAHYNKLCEFFLGEKTLVAHNLPFDRKVLKFELQRYDKMTQFPWCYQHICTIEIGEYVWGRKRKLGDIYKEVTGKDHDKAHRSVEDVLAMVEIIRWYKKEGHL